MAYILRDKEHVFGSPSWRNCAILVH